MIEPLTKGLPRVIEKKLKRAAIEKNRVEVKGDVFRRDGGRCRCCGGYAMEMHELKTRGSGGKRSLYNSIAVCNFSGNNCHRLIQVRAIRWRFVNESMGADSAIEFTMGPKMWTSRPNITIGG